MNSEQLMTKIVSVLAKRKTEDIKVLDISSLTTIADYFVICSGTSSTQIKSLAGEVEEKLREEDIMLYSKEGFGDASWILLDYSSVVVHIFNPEQREFYGIENLWSDGNKVDISDIIEECSKM